MPCARVYRLVGSWKIAFIFVIPYTHMNLPKKPAIDKKGALEVVEMGLIPSYTWPSPRSSVSMPTAQGPT